MRKLIIFKLLLLASWICSAKSIPCSEKACVKLEEATRVADFIRFSIKKEGDKLIGYEVREPENEKLFYKAGFRLGDIIKEVNGIPANDPKRIRDVYYSVIDKRDNEFVIERNKEKKCIRIELSTE